MSSIVRTSLRQFLHTSRQSLLASLKAKKPVNIVIGNQSADIDSFASSILYAYYTGPTTPPTIPLLSIPREDLSLRPEILHLCNLFSISPSDLNFTDDPPITDLPQDSTNIALVDHNHIEPNLSSHFTDPAKAVTAVIDHHDDEGLYPDAKPRIITPSGSCSSLVTQHFQSAFPQSGDVRGELARLALAAVLIDTTNMTNKVTPHDEEVLAFLEAEIAKSVTEGGGAGEPWDRKKFYNGVWDAKNNVDAMPLRDLLRKDWKEWAESVAGVDGVQRKVGIASVLRELEWLKGREAGEGFVEGVRSWAGERGLDVVSVMTTTGRGGDFRRELFVWVLNEGAEGCLEAFVRMAEEAGLGLSVWGGGALDGDNGRRRAWCQKNLKASRKQVAPLLRESIKVGAKRESKV
ncbi:DHH phosphoesterase [Morchella conica CCBAS932]|uniref:DHH phosphoesterase n=1 Tax=Morchella conica CCBAS932 TaxID=1392247 RepID=A0A3N4KSS9_9PEZI|nr:DHH phosphoesterase [Morchella conica CCBAS932]